MNANESSINIIEIPSKNKDIIEIPPILEEYNDIFTIDESETE